MALFLAVDAGGTKTEFLLADQHRELARARTGTIKLMRADAATAARHLDEALADLRGQTGDTLEDVMCTCIGAAGWTVPVVADWMRTAFAARLPGTLVLVGDVEIALDAAFHGGPGVLVLAGTGSNVAGRNAGGEVMTVGGWGPVLADQGSGHRIGQQALRALFLAIDQRRETALLQAVLDRWKLKDIAGLMAFLYSTPAPDLSRLAQTVAQSAEAGDGVAKEVLATEARELAHLAALMIERIQSRTSDAGSSVSGDSAGARRIAFAGSIMQHVVPVRAAIVAELRGRWSDLEVTPGVVDPLLGALWRARTAARAGTE